MRSHNLEKACWRQICCKLSTDLVQVDCQNLLSTGLLQAVSKSCNKFVTTTSCNKPIILTDLLQLDEIDRFVATC